MASPSQIREDCAAALLKNCSRVADLRAFIGLDGFVDSIVHMVNRRHDAQRYDRLRTMTEMGDRVLAAAGKSTNIEGVIQQVKLGGNGPIMANALAALGLKVTYLGALGWPNLHPVFQELADRATTISIADPGNTDALEFEDGKLMITKTVSLNDVTWENIQARFGRDRLEAQMREADLIGFVNWTMIPYMSDVWEVLLREICPSLSRSAACVFFDLADPEKRTREDRRRALDLIQRFNTHFKAVLGLNEKETWEVAAVLDLDTTRRDRDALTRTAHEIARRVRLDTLVVHPTKYALAIHDGQLEEVEGPFDPNPKLTTGAGDHFNAGFCLGKLLGLNLTCALLAGVTTSGFYVRNARSPSVTDLAKMLRNWPV